MIISFIFIYVIYFHMVKKVVHPKVLIHLTIDPELKQFLIDNNINASELLEKAILELMDISKQENEEDIMEYYPDVKKRLEHNRILIGIVQFEDKAYYREQLIRAMQILRHNLGFNVKDAKKLLEKYVDDKKQEIMENKEDLMDYHDRENTYEDTEYQ